MSPVELAVDVVALRRRARRIREHILDLCAGPEGGHLGGSMSIVEILATLYFGVLRVDPERPRDPDRDILVLSKGHGAIALYATLAERGFFPIARLASYGRPGSALLGHPGRDVPGVEAATGSLGHGLALGAGFALAAPSSPPPPGPAAPALAPAAVDVRITGFWRWKTVLVPPNAFVVHTRRGHDEPMHIGLGMSFRYDPATDSYLVVPGAMQTILINAYSICRELQGVLVQAYVQWIIQDFATAYRKLDFSDPEDPMRLVNLQLKEQAEAAIKDKVATMGVHEVLSDKQPIMEELTARLRSVAEGEGDSDQGLGLRIVTVQIKEAVVSSARLWENLQKPFRAGQGQLARLAELEAEGVINEREMAAQRQRETRRMEDERELSELRSRNERRLAELQSETTTHALRLERERHAEESEVGRLRIEQEYALKGLALNSELAMTRAQAESTHESGLLDLERHRIRAGIDNDQTPASIQAQLVASLPEIVAKLPKPTELRSVTIGGNDATTLAGLVAELGAVVGALRSALSSAD